LYQLSLVDTALIGHNSIHSLHAASVARMFLSTPGLINDHQPETSSLPAMTFMLHAWTHAKIPDSLSKTGRVRVMRPSVVAIMLLISGTQEPDDLSAFQGRLSTCCSC
jgi:hypothetical protein